MDAVFHLFPIVLRQLLCFLFQTFSESSVRHITPSFSEGKVRAFSATFVNASSVLSEPEQKIVEVYIRVKPDLIPYNKAFTDKIRFEDLLLGARIPLESFPIQRQLREEHKQDMEDEKQEKKDAERRVKLGLILAEWGTQNKVEVTREDLQQAIWNEASRYPDPKQVFEF